MKKLVFAAIITICALNQAHGQLELEYTVFDVFGVPEKTIELPLHGEVNCSVDWGDGSIELITSTGNHTHTYNANGIKSVTVTGSVSHFGSYEIDFNPFLTRVLHWDSVGLLTLDYAFHYAPNLIQVPNHLPDFVTSCRGMFLAAVSFNQPLSSWNVAKITDMRGMFNSATRFNQPIGNWSVGKVTDMAYMFSEASDFNQPINSWDISNVKTIYSMFHGAESFNQAIDKWDVSKVTDMSNLFLYAKSFNQPLEAWDVSHVTKLSSMFANASQFNQPLARWDVSNVLMMNGMFHRASNFNQPIGGWNISKVNTTRSMFENASKFNQPLNNWDVSSVKDMSNMFFEANEFNQNINNWDVGEVGDMTAMFFNAKEFNEPIESWDVGNVSSMWSMFFGATNFNQPLENWDVSQVTIMKFMFRAASGFNQPLGNWDIRNVGDMTKMFYETSLCTENYNQLLIGWGQQEVHAGISFHGGTSKYSLEVEDSRELLIEKGWVIADSGVGSSDHLKCLVTSVYSSDEENTLVFPNPCSNEVILTTPFVGSMVTLVNLQNNPIKKFMVTDRQTTINLDGVASGTYLLHLNGKESSLVEKLIIQ